MRYIGLYRPNEAHTPARVRLGVRYEAFRTVLPGLAIKAPGSEIESGGDRSIIIQAVGFDGVVSAFFEKRRDVGDDIPWPHKSVQIDVIYSFHFRSFGRTSTENRRGKNDEE